MGDLVGERALVSLVSLLECFQRWERFIAFASLVAGEGGAGFGLVSSNIKLARAANLSSFSSGDKPLELLSISKGLRSS